MSGLLLCRLLYLCLLFSSNKRAPTAVDYYCTYFFFFANERAPLSSPPAPPSVLLNFAPHLRFSLYVSNLKHNTIGNTRHKHADHHHHHHHHHTLLARRSRCGGDQDPCPCLAPPRLGVSPSSPARRACPGCLWPACSSSGSGSCGASGCGSSLPRGRGTFFISPSSHHHEKNKKINETQDPGPVIVSIAGAHVPYFRLVSSAELLGAALHRPGVEELLTFFRSPSHITRDARRPSGGQF